MMLYIWAGFGIINWYFFLKYVFENIKEIDTEHLTRVIPYILFFSMFFGPVWTLGIALYYIGMNLDKNR